MRLVAETIRSEEFEFSRCPHLAAVDKRISNRPGM